MVVALADLVEDRAMRERIANHNRAVPPPFDWSDVLDRTSTLYRRAAGHVTAEAPATQATATLALEA
jgi:hypothetical protein